MFESENMLSRAVPKNIKDNMPLAMDSFLSKQNGPQLSVFFDEKPNQFDVKGSNSTSSGIVVNSPTGIVSPLDLKVSSDSIDEGQGNVQVPPTSYAAWKQQMMPKFGIPEGGNGGNNSQENSFSQSSNTATMSNTSETRRAENNMHYPMNRANWPNAYYNNNAPSVPPNGQAPFFAKNAKMQGMQRHSLDAANQNNFCSRSLETRDVLTICAGTQTNVVGEFPSEIIGNLATKEHIQKLIDLVSSMSTEQQRLRGICETLLQKNELFESSQRIQETSLATSKIIYRDVGIQCEELSAQSGDHLNNYSMSSISSNSLSSAEKTNQTLLAPEEPKSDNQPKDCSEMQCPSTVPEPQATSPLHSMGPTEQEANSGSAFSVKKQPKSEKNKVMSDLALKYLSKEKFEEILEDSSISSTSRCNTPTITASAPILMLRPQPGRLRNVDVMNAANHSEFRSDNSAGSSFLHLNTSPQRRSLGSPGNRNTHIDIEQFKGQTKFQ